MPSVTLRIHYLTQPGESLLLERRVSSPESDGTRTETHSLQHDGNGFWSARFEGSEPGCSVQYRYAVRSSTGDIQRESVFRRLHIVGEVQVIWDHWLAPELPDGAFLRQAFAGVIFRPGAGSEADPLWPGGHRFRLTLRAPRIAAGHRFCVSGGHPLLGDWDPARARPMSAKNYPLWELDLPADKFTQPFDFKFGLWDEGRQRLVEFEQGANRRFHGVPQGFAVLVVNFETYRHAEPWRGAGVVIPVFSLRTERGYGVGEFTDLAPFAEWAASCGLHLVQLLPINDTSSDFTWKDSYPYKAISTAALHPIYLNVEQLFRDCKVSLPDEYAKRREVLNRLAQLDYEAVLKDKLKYVRDLFRRLGRSATGNRQFKRYVSEQEGWLQPYAAFCRLRDRLGTADFSQWGEYATYPAKEVRAWFKAGAPEQEEVMFHCWVQFHLDRQLSSALAAGHARGVAFKGDLPIGIDRCSVEAWTEPELFRMDRQTGAPPDAFAVLGQTWGFPTYDWRRMEADGYQWWRRRFHRMSAAFDALRIDHILEFFRIWEIPQQYRKRILSHYSPTLPLSPEEIRHAGFLHDPTQFVSGTVAIAMVAAFFGDAATAVTRDLLVQDADGFCRLRPEFSIRAAREAWYAAGGSGLDPKTVEEALTRLSFEVLFVPEPDQPNRFHPRINLADTALFRALPANEQAALRYLHDDFYYRRHTRFWAEEAMKKLPALMDASSMLICGEDLGMVPDSVPLVLRRLGLLSLEVQRWPKQLGRTFGAPAEYPYLSVCTTSTHDMSTIRGWWEEEPEARRRFFDEVMHRHGEPPAECTPEICQFVVSQNLAAPSMWCILPLQDWLGIDPKLRHPEPGAERINVPAIPRHYWRYRMHLTVEALRNAEEFNRAVATLVATSGRNRNE